MPCLPRERGCASDHTVGVRFLDGFHFCADPGFAAAGVCPADQAGGQRRAAAAIAAELVSSLQATHHSG
jgi:hypothetical protein